MRKIYLILLFCLFIIPLGAEEIPLDINEFYIYFTKPSNIAFNFYENESLSKVLKEVTFELLDYNGNPTHTSATFYVGWDIATETPLQLSMISSSTEDSSIPNDSCLKPKTGETAPSLNYGVLVDDVRDRTVSKEEINNDLSLADRTSIIVERTASGVRNQGNKKITLDLNSYGDAFMSGHRVGYLTLKLTTV